MGGKWAFQRKEEEGRIGPGYVKAEHLISLDTERKWSCSGSIMQAVTSGGGARLKGWMSLSLSLSLTNPIKSSAVRCASTRIHTVYAKARPGRPVHSHDIYTHSAYKAKCNEKRSSHFSDEIKDPST